MVGKKEKHLAAAQKLLERGQLEKALAEFAKVVEEDPKDTRVWLKMAEVQAKRGATDEAAAVYLKTGDLYIEQGFAQKAVAVYKNVVKLTPSAIDAYLKLGSLYKQLGLMNDSAQQYEAAATLYQRSGKLKEAVNAFRLVVEVQPESLAAHIKLAELAAQAGSAEEAGRSFGKAADLLKAQGRIDEYLRVLERLLHHQPDNFARSREAADVYISRGNPRAAIAKLQACRKVDPRDPATLTLLVQCYEQLENKPKAVSMLKELVRVSHETGESVERDTALKRALALDPTDAELVELAGLYRVRTTMGPSPFRGLAGLPNVSGARAPTASIPVPAPAAAPAPMPARDAARLFAETEVFAKYGLLERAEQHARKLLAAHPQHPEGRALLARILEEARKEDETEQESLELPRREDADDGIPLALDLSAAPLRPLRLATPELTSSDVLDADQAEELDLDELEEMSADAISEDELTMEDELVVATPGLVLSSDDDPAAAEVTPPPLGASVDLPSDLDLPEHTQAVIPLAVPVRSGLVAHGLELADDESGRFDNEPSARKGSRPAAPPRGLAVDPHATPPPPVIGPDIEADLAQVDFFLSQDMTQEASEVLGRLTPRHALDPRVKKRVAAVEASANATPGLSAPPRRGPSPLGAVPQTPQAVRRSGPIGAPITPPPGIGLPPVPKVKLSQAELDGHADLGVAYKEMGLFDQAIGEFRALESAPSRAVFAMTMTAECLESLGRLSEAAALYKRALNTEGVTDAETVVLYYGLGRAFEGLGDVTEARYFYEKVVRRDARFRDAAARIANLQRPVRAAEKQGP